MNNVNDKQPKRLEVYLQEYNKLKDEQTQRIGFRDNLLYVTLVAFGAILSFALSQETSEVASKAASDVANHTNYYALLVIPWVCLILGWAYLVNDQKISALAKYFRENLREKVNQELGIKATDEPHSTFGWETENIRNGGRRQRKIEQFIINEIAFVVSGIVALVTLFWLLCVSGVSPPLLVKVLGGIEFVLLLILGVEIGRYAELGVAQSNDDQDEETKETPRTKGQKENPQSPIPNHPATIQRPEIATDRSENKTQD